ncbi:permease-like cell division protein FtsX [Amycolatopsis regifaucium]|uniref:permease-like cell division protein FtsX n=1 Tax=Amycolatopsis regifaucium TaxID=546365 RepID=UPI00094244E1|nr:permease-like cell division protein FtsX [Amycolatopsis regifaucium]
MEEPQRKPWVPRWLFWVIGVAAVLIAGAVATTAIVMFDRFGTKIAPPSSSAVALPRDAEPVPLGGRELCGKRLMISAETDEAMRAIAQALREEPKARRVLTETKKESYERFKKLFANDPELVRLTRPEVLPAVVHLLPVAGTDFPALADELRRRFPEAQKVDVLDPAAIAAEMTVTPPPCPPEGER